MEEHYPKFQYSKFYGQDQIVVRADTIEEFKLAILDMRKAIDEIVGTKEGLPEVQEKAVEEETRHCDFHKVLMVKKISKRNGKPYFGHMVDGEMCFGNGIKEYRK